MLALKRAMFPVLQTRPKGWVLLPRVRSAAHVTALSFSPEGFLAVGSSDGVSIYDTDLLSKAATPSYVGFHGDVSMIHWFVHVGGALHIVFGTTNGFLVLWSKTEGAGGFRHVYDRRMDKSKITSITSNIFASVLYIAIGFEVGAIITLTYGHDGIITYNNDGVDLSDVIPRAMILTTATQLLIAGDGSGRLVNVDMKSEADPPFHHLSPVIGSAAFHGHMVVVDNGVDGYTMFKTVDGSLERAFIVGGSDHGITYVFNVHGDSPPVELFHARFGDVRHVATFDCPDGGVIVASALQPRLGTAGRSDGVTLWKTRDLGGLPVHGSSRNRAASSTVFKTLNALVWGLCFTCLFALCKDGLQTHPVLREILEKPEQAWHWATTRRQVRPESIAWASAPHAPVPRDDIVDSYGTVYARKAISARDSGHVHEDNGPAHDSASMPQVRKSVPVRQDVRAHHAAPRAQHADHVRAIQPGQIRDQSPVREVVQSVPLHRSVQVHEEVRIRESVYMGQPAHFYEHHLATAPKEFESDDDVVQDEVLVDQ